MESILFGFRKEHVSEGDALGYVNTVGNSLLSSLGFSLERSQAHIAGGATRTYRDAGESLIEHFHTLANPDLQHSISVHVNVFHVTSFPERVQEIRRKISDYSKSRGYTAREGLADSLSLI